MQSTRTELPDWDDAVRCAEAGFAWCLCKARRCRTLDQMDAALGWLSLAAWSAAGSGFFGKMAAIDLEMELEKCAEQIDLIPFKRDTVERKRWLHVLDEAYVIGGHTALCARWIEARATDERHSVLLLAQREPIPEKLTAAVQSAGGEVHALDPRLGLMERARQLRFAACNHADVVVLHTHTDSVVPSIAFGRKDGPRVIVLNHADHAFQATSGIADLVFDIRESGQAWTRDCRGIRSTTIVPLPLLDEFEGEEPARAQAEKQHARERLGLPQESVILLTVGSAFKYTPVQGLGFQAAIEPVLKAHPEATLVAVGPEDDGEWRRLRKATGGRVLALGRKEDLRAFHRSADIYVEGFPSGSLTAMLEAGLAGLPCVRAPIEVPPPFCSDGVAFEVISQPASISDYGDQISALIRNAGERKRQGALIRASVRAHHCASGWVQHLELGIGQLPVSHSVNFSRKLAGVSLKQRNYYLALVHRLGADPAKMGAAILGEATARGLEVHQADFEELGAMLQSALEGTQPGATRDHSGAAVMARRLKQATRIRLRQRRLLALWEEAKGGILHRLGIVSAARTLGRVLVGDLRR